VLELRHGAATRPDPEPKLHRAYRPVTTSIGCEQAPKLSLASPAPAAACPAAPIPAAPAAPVPSARSLDRAAAGILGAMISLIIVLTVVLLELSPAAEPSGVARGDDGGVTSAAVPVSKS